MRNDYYYHANCLSDNRVYNMYWLVSDSSMDEAVKKTLKEKWHDHWDKKENLMSPSKQMNLLGIIFFWSFTASLMYTSLVIIIPRYSGGTTTCVMSMVVYLIFIESAVNWILAARSWTSKVLPKTIHASGELPSGWKNCVTCQLVMPPRAHHCKICNMCVLKRDHHCFFTGKE